MAKLLWTHKARTSAVKEVRSRVHTQAVHRPEMCAWLGVSAWSLLPPAPCPCYVCLFLRLRLRAVWWSLSGLWRAETQFCTQKDPHCTLVAQDGSQDLASPFQCLHISVQQHTLIVMLRRRVATSLRSLRVCVCVCSPSRYHPPQLLFPVSSYDTTQFCLRPRVNELSNHTHTHTHTHTNTHAYTPRATF